MRWTGIPPPRGPPPYRARRARRVCRLGGRRWRCSGGPRLSKGTEGGAGFGRCWIQALQAVAGELRHAREQIGIDVHIHLGVSGIELLTLRRNALVGASRVLCFEADRLERAGGGGELRAG